MPPRRTSRNQVLNQPRSGARPLGGSPGPARPSGPQQPPPTTARTVPRRGGRTRPASSPTSPSPPPRTGRPAGGTGSSGSGGTSRTSTTGRAGGSAQTAGASSSRRAGGSPQQGRQRRSLPGAPRRTRGGGEPGKTPAYHNYQAIVLAEFVAAELLVAATPIATKKNKPGLSPYVPRDLVKLIALGLVYFTLQLVASGGRGGARFAAWFGALVLLAVGLNEAADLAKVFDVLSGGSGKPAKTTAVTTAAQNDTLTSFVPPTVGGTSTASPGGSSPSPSSGRRKMSSGGGQPPDDGMRGAHG
jgi:hypothetical protein